MSFEPIRDQSLPPLPSVKQMSLLVDDLNYSQLDMYAQIILRELPDDPHANLAASWVAKKFNQNNFFQSYFAKASLGKRAIADLADDLHINLVQLDSSFNNLKNISATVHNERKFHLMKAWGFGFGSEMAALMGQTYLAEMLGRTPVVHWGENFLYRNSGSDCVFAEFFEPFNEWSINTITKVDGDFYPPKWNKDNILKENIHKKQGPYSKLSALYFLSRKEVVTISDYYSGVINIKPWLPESHSLSKLNFDQTYRYLANKYLKPNEAIRQEVNNFINQNFGKPYLAVHARGSDKDEGYRAMTSLPIQKLNYVKKRFSEMPRGSKIFLMTDDVSLLKKYSEEFGQRLVTTNSQRSSTQQGVHYDPKSNKLNAGREMLIDMLIAAKAKSFVGLGLSNPSQLIRYFGDFCSEDYVLFGENRLKQFNTHLYKTISVL